MTRLELREDFLYELKAAAIGRRRAGAGGRCPAVLAGVTSTRPDPSSLSSPRGGAASGPRP
jgi:hypothetical protein